MATDKVIILTTENFESEVLKSQTPVFVDFWAQWCGPCRMIAPLFEELSDEFEGKVKFAKVNVDDEGDIASKYKIMSIPTMMFFKNGEVVDKIIGARSKDELTEFINKSM